MIKLLKRLFTSSDELVGIWETTNGGGFQMIMGSRLEFRKDGTGKLEDWGNGGDDEEPYDSYSEFVWKRTGKNKIEVRYAVKSKFEEVEYEMRDYKGAYGIHYDELFSPNQPLGETGFNGFWAVPTELYRKRIL